MAKLLAALKAAKALLSTVKLSQEPLQNGSIIQYDGDDIEKGATVYLQDGNSDFSILADGLYQTKSGKKFTITDGVCTEIDDSTETPSEDSDELKEQAQAKVKTEEENSTEKIDDKKESKEDTKKAKAAKVKARKEKAIALKKEIVETSKKLKADTNIAPPGAGANLPDDTTDGTVDDDFDDYDEEDSTETTTSVVVNISDVIGAALQPVYQQIYDLQSIVSALKDIITSQKAQTVATQTSLSKVIDQVAVIANLPAGSPIETQVETFVKKEKTSSKAMKIMAAGAEYEKNLQTK